MVDIRPIQQAITHNIPARPAPPPRPIAQNWAGRQVDAVVNSKTTMHLASGVEKLARGVQRFIKAIPVIKDVYSAGIEKVVELARKTPIQSPPAKLIVFAGDILDHYSKGGNYDDAMKMAAFTLKNLEDDHFSPKSTVSRVLEIEQHVRDSGVNLNAGDNDDFAMIARAAVIRAKGKEMPVPKEIKLSILLEPSEQELGYTCEKSHPASPVAVYFNADRNWQNQKIEELAKSRFSNHMASTPDTLHMVYHQFGSALYNGAVGDEPILKSMPEAPRHIATTHLSYDMKTPRDFMGEMYAHLMGNTHKKELTSAYLLYEDWGGKFPKGFSLEALKPEK